MLIDNKTSRFLEGHYIFFGFIFLIPGVMSLYLQQWLFAGIQLFISWFLFATFSGVEINNEKYIFRQYTQWFGLFKTGKWKPLNNYIGLSLVSMKKVQRMYSRSNRSNTSSKNEYRVYLVNARKAPAVSIKKCKTPEEGQRCLDELAIWLKLPVYSIAR